MNLFARKRKKVNGARVMGVYEKLLADFIVT
jgi:hypothetical protein